VQDHQGLFVSLESSDAAVRKLHSRLLAERLRAVGYEVSVFSFPQTGVASSHFVESYQQGDYGLQEEISPYAATLFYSLDHFEASSEIRSALKKSHVVLSDGYAGLNMGLQGSKFTNEAQQRGFFVWADTLEFQLLGIPRPRVSLVLQQSKLSINHLGKTYQLLCELFPKDFQPVSTAKDSNKLSIPAISNKLWGIIKPLLPEKPPHRPRGRSLRLDQADSTPKEANPPPKPAISDASQKKPAGISMEGLSLLLVRDLMQLKLSSPLKIDEDYSSGSKEPIFYTPSKLPSELKKDYSQGLQQILKLQKKISQSLFKKPPSGVEKPAATLKASQLAALLGPMAQLTSIKLGSGTQELPKLAAHLAVSQLPEARTVLKRLPNDYRINPRPANRVVSRLAEQLSATFAPEGETVKINRWQPRNELDFLAALLYPSVSMPLRDLATTLETWEYGRRLDILGTFLKDLGPDGSYDLLSAVRYELEILSNLAALNFFYSTKLYDSLVLQAPTVRYGYCMPAQIENTIMEEDFAEAFDISLELYSKLQDAGFEEEAGYVVLSGHRNRWQTGASASQLYRLSALSTSSPDWKELWRELRAKVLEVHPLIGATLQPKKPIPRR